MDSEKPNKEELETVVPTNPVPQKPTSLPEGKVVWIACRAHENCIGNHAVMLSTRASASAPGEFLSHQGGRFTRYRCTTCNGTFVIRT